MGEVISFDGRRRRTEFIPAYPQTKAFMSKTTPPGGSNQHTEGRVLYCYVTLRQSVEVISAREGLRRLFVQDVIRRALALGKAA